MIRYIVVVIMYSVRPSSGIYKMKRGGSSKAGMQ